MKSFVATSTAATAADAGKVYLTSLEPDVYDTAPQPTRLNGPKTTTIVAEGRAKGLVFWSPETPHLYDVTVTLVGEDGTVLDSETIRTGFRHVAYDAAKGGLLVNGRNVWLPGYAQRATDEWAAIGVAPDWLQDYDAALIRRSNANFVRWMHVAPKPAPVRAFEKRHGAKIYVGEFSAPAWAPGADRYIADCIALFREYGWDWTYHAFREWEGWSVEHEPVKFGTSHDCFRPSADNPRKRALLEGLKRGTPP